MLDIAAAENTSVAQTLLHPEVVHMAATRMYGNDVKLVGNS